MGHLAPSSTDVGFTRTFRQPSSLIYPHRWRIHWRSPRPTLQYLSHLDYVVDQDDRFSDHIASTFHPFDHRLEDKLNPFVFACGEIACFSGSSIDGPPSRQYHHLHVHHRTYSMFLNQFKLVTFSIKDILFLI